MAMTRRGHASVQAASDGTGYAITVDWNLRLGIGCCCSLETGTAITVPDGCVGLLVPACGVSSASGVALAGGVEVMASGATSPISPTIVNAGDEAIDIEGGTTVARLVLLPVIQPDSAALTAC